MSLKEYDNLLEFPDQNLQQNNDVLFKKKIHFRPELLTMLNEKENFNDPIYRNKIDDNNKKEGIYLKTTKAIIINNLKKK